MLGYILKAVKSDAACASASTALKSVGRIGAMIFLARVAGVEAVAALTLLVAIEAIVICSTNALFASPAAVLAPGRRAVLRGVIHRFAERSQLYTGCLLGAIGLGVCAALAVDIELMIVGGFVASLVLSCAYQAKRSTCISEFRARRVLWAEAAIASSTLLLPVLLALFTPVADVSAVALFWIVQAVMHGAAAGALCMKERRPAFRARTHVYARRVARKSVLCTGIAMLRGSLALSASLRVQPMLAAALTGPIGTASLGIANTFAAPIRLMSGSLRSALLPRMALANQRGHSNCVRVRLVHVAPGCFVMIGGLTFVQVSAPVVIKLVFGDAFVVGSSVVTLVVLFALMSTMTALLGGWLQAKGKSGQCANIRWVGSLASIGGMLAFTPAFGILGLVVGAIAGEALTLALLLMRGLGKGRVDGQAERIRSRDGFLEWWAFLRRVGARESATGG